MLSFKLPAHRAITSELSGGGPELRLKQELLLGIGGWRLLAALGIRQEVCHFNEGHAAFAVLERARDFTLETALPFDAAMAVTRAGNLFTTHTAVPAGLDRLDPGLVAHYLGPYAEQTLGITLHDFNARTGFPAHSVRHARPGVFARRTQTAPA
jgi:starch phosphorylase